MFSSLSISAKVQLPLVIAIVLGFIIVGITSYQTLNKMEEYAFEKEAEKFEVALNDQIKSKNDVWITNALQLAINSDIQEGIISGDKEVLVETFAGIGKMYSENTPFKKVNIHILTPDLNSFF